MASIARTATSGLPTERRTKANAVSVNGTGSAGHDAPPPDSLLSGRGPTVRSVSEDAQMRRFAPTVAGIGVVVLAAGFLGPAQATDGWQRPVQVSMFLEGVSCPTTTFCLAVDPSGESYTFDGQSWSGPTDMMDRVYGYGLSCASSTFCMAVNSQYEGEADWSVFDGTAWTEPARLRDAVGPVALRCVTSTFCIAVDEAGNAYKYTAQGWGKGTPNGVGGRNLSCPSTNFCMALGYHTAATFDGKTWSKPQQVLNGQSQFWSVSCPQAGTCVGLDTFGRVFTYQDGQWSRATKVERRNRDPRTISCGSVNLCVITDDSGHAAVGAVAGTWTSQKIDPAARYYMDVSCQGDSFCVAVNGGGDAISYTG